MVRDMMVPPDMPLNDLNRGNSEAAPRALPQDAALSVFFASISATWLVAFMVISCCLMSVVTTARLVQRATGGGLLVQMAASLLVVWNPFTIERMLQGHWSVVTAMWLLPAVAYFAALARFGVLALFLGICAFTPTGWLLGGAVALAFCVRRKTMYLIPIAQLLLAAPWLLVTVVNSPTVGTDALSASLFAARAEPAVGTLGALMGFGGIWNAQAVPGSRTAISTLVSVALFLFTLLGAKDLWRCYRRATVLTAMAIVLPFLFSTGPGISLMGWIVETIPGAGLLRDTQKFVALAVPGVVLMFAIAVEKAAQIFGSKHSTPETTGTHSVQSHTSKRSKQGHANKRSMQGVAVGAMLLTICTVPLLPKEIAPLKPQPLEPEWQQIVTAVADSPDSRTLLLPPGNYRMHGNTPVVDPALKLLPGQPLDPSFLIVDGHLVDGNDEAIELLSDTMNGRDTLARKGVGWVLLDRKSIAPGTDTSLLDSVLARHTQIVTGNGLELYQVENPAGVPTDKSSWPLEFGLLLYWAVTGFGFCMATWRVSQGPRTRLAARQAENTAVAASA